MRTWKQMWTGAVALGGILFVCLAASSSAAGELEERIRTLEETQRANAEELAKLKGEQMELRKEATAAAAALPSFTYRPRRGLLIEAADKSWAVRTFARLHYRMMFWPDNTVVASSGFSQGDVALRRWRMGFNPSWQDGFYALDWEVDGGADRSIQIQKGEFHVDFSKLNVYFPTLVLGLRASAFFSRHDTNWGSSTGGLFDRSMFQDGAGVGAGSQNNAIALNWNDVPILDTGTFLFQAIYSNQGLINEADLQRPNSDNRAAHLAFNLQPFSRTKDKWLRGIDFGVSYHLDQLGDSGKGLAASSPATTRNFFRVRTTERQRLRLIELSRNAMGQRHLTMPHFGWRVGPYWLRTSFGHNKGEQVNGRGIEAWMWRISNELFVWSPKGFLTGSNTAPGSVMLFTGFERTNMRAADNGLRDCGTVGGNCTSAYAYNNNVGAWYIVRPGLRVGAEYGFYHVNKIGRGADDIGKTRGSAVDFHSIELGITFDF
jgi:hypothetical protein